MLETINHDQVRETTKTNVASIMLLASSPARLNGLRIVSRDGNEVEVAWDPSPENSVFEYVVRWGPPGGPYEEGVVDMARAWLDVPGGTLVSVKSGQRPRLAWLGLGPHHDRAVTRQRCRPDQVRNPPNRPPPVPPDPGFDSLGPLSKP